MAQARQGGAADAPAERVTGEATGPGVRRTRIGAMGHILLDRPQVLNAFDAAMRREVGEAYRLWAGDPMIYCVVMEGAGERAFCAGGDLAEMVRLGRESLDAAIANAADEFAANWRLECFSRPNVALIDGHVIGSGVGLTQYGTHRVAGERYAFSMPEVRVGFFPDCGVSTLFGRMPDEIGLYLALTGRRVGPGDALRLGLATHCIARRHFEAVKAALADAQPVDPLLDGFHSDPGPGDIEPVRGLIRQCFSAPSVLGILERLGAVEGEHREWARGVAADLALASPTSLAVTYRLVRMGASLDLAEALRLDLRIAARLFAGHDFYEGAGALLAGGGARPGWRPATLSDVREEDVAAHFKPLGERELAIAERRSSPPPLG